MYLRPVICNIDPVRDYFTNAGSGPRTGVFGADRSEWLTEITVLRMYCTGTYFKATVLYLGNNVRYTVDGVGSLKDIEPLHLPLIFPHES
jgi:hypothetical protein